MIDPLKHLNEVIEFFLDQLVEADSKDFNPVTLANWVRDALQLYVDIAAHPHIIRRTAPSYNK